MGVRQTSEYEVAAAMRDRCLDASRAGRGRRLDEFCAATDYHRSHAKAILRNGTRTSRPRIGTRREGRPSTAAVVMAALRIAAGATGCICGKRPTRFLGELLPALERIYVLLCLRQGLSACDEAGRESPRRRHGSQTLRCAQGTSTEGR
jgi:hypothetical protein